jgi:hypothetical protein
MNRAERRKMEKKLGLDKVKKSLPRNLRWEKVRQNIADGNKKEEAMKESVRVQDQKDNDAKINSQISSRALDLMIKDGMDYYSATEKAKEEFSTK